MNMEMEKDVKLLKRDLTKFQNDISSVISDVGHYSHDKVADTKNKLGTAMKDFGELAGDKTKNVMSTSKKLITKKPAATIATIAAFGILSTWFLKKRKSK